MKSASPGQRSSETALPNFMSANLRVLRKQMGWSQSQLGDRVNLNRGNIASYESGCAEPNICNTLKISKLFDVSPHDLIRRDLSDPPQLVLARIAHSQNQQSRRELLSDYRNKGLQLDELVRSSRSLFEFKRKNLAKPCSEADMFAMQYEQLHQLTTELMQNYRNLLADISCQCDG